MLQRSSGHGKATNRRIDPCPTMEMQHSAIPVARLAGRGPSLLFTASFILTGCSAVKTATAIINDDDRSPRPDVCLLVAPAGLRPTELDGTITHIVDEVARAHGHLSGFVAFGPSAGAFARLHFDASANGGRFDSDAASSGQRSADAATWRTNATDEVHAQLHATGDGQDGLDLLGGIAQCTQDLSRAARSPIVVVVSHGIHRTADLDLAEQPERAGEIPARIPGLVPAPIRLDIYELGRVEPAAIGGPVARHVIEPVVAAWQRACRALAQRCLSVTPSQKDQP
jgi:hypothetical protein